MGVEEPIELSLLGTPHLFHGGLRLDLPDTVPGYLLAILAARGDWVRREEVSVLFWPEAGTDEAQHNLRVNLNRLRPLLARWRIEDRLRSERRRLRLDLPTDTAMLRADLASSDWLGAARRPRGDFLQGLSFRAFAVVGEWAAAQRELLRADWRRAIERAAAIATPDLLLELAGRYLEVDRADETIMRIQFQALQSLGRPDEARRLFERHDRWLRSEQGHGVGRELARLIEQAGLASNDSAVQPVEFDALVGREGELATLVERLASDRLVTLTGMGGVGKTRLARAVMTVMAPRFVDGTLWLPLADLSGMSEVWRRLASLLGLALDGGREPLRRLAEHLSSRAMLIVFDNAEQLLEERDAFLNALTLLLDAAPSSRLLVTSRAPLRHPREHVVPLQNLRVPEGQAPSEVLASPAVQLFVALARRARGSFEPLAAVDALRRIARATGGLPLALRIAASWSRLLPCSDIAAELDTGLDALSSASDENPGVRAVFERSWQRIAPALREQMARLSVFASPFELDAAKAVSDASPTSLAALVDASLLELIHQEGDAVARFDLHPLVRQFARERLAADPRVAESARERHARHVLRRLTPFADWRRIDQRAALIAIGALHEEIVAAWQWALAAADVDFIAQATPIWSSWLEQRGRWDEGIARFGDAQALFDEQDRRELAALAALARARATLLYRKTDTDAAEVAARQALTWSRALGHRTGIKSSLNTLALALWESSRYPEALPYAQEACALARQDADLAGEAIFTGTVALIEKMLGHYDNTEASWRRVLDLHRQIGNWRSAANVYNNLGNLLRMRDRFDEAQALLSEGLRLCDEHGFVSTRPFLLINLAQLQRDRGQAAAAREFAELALLDVRRSGERKIETATHLVLSDLEIRDDHIAAAADHLSTALKLASATGDVANHLEALDGYGRWLDRQGEHQSALAVWRALLLHPQIHAELRDPLRDRLRSVGGLTSDPQGSDLVLLTERAMRRLKPGTE